MTTFYDLVSKVDDFVWGPVMLILLVGTGIFLTIRVGFLTWLNLGYAIKSTLSKEARTKSRGTGDVSPFSALTTALAATIGTGNIVGVATAMVAGGPGALVWMWISALFGLTSKFSECMLAIKYREVNENGEMSGGPMYTMRKALKNKTFGAILGWLFALFAVISSFGIGNMTQGNSIASALNATFDIPQALTGIIITVLSLFIIVGGIKSISKVSSVIVPLMAIFYVVCGLIVIIGNIQNVPAGLSMIFSMAFSPKAIGGGLCGGIVASMMNAVRFGVARGVFSNEAGMGSAAITAAAATTDHPVRQGYINMTGTFWDTIVVCTITGLVIASSGTLGSRTVDSRGTFQTISAESAESSSAAANGSTITLAPEGSSAADYVITENPDGTILLTNPEKSLDTITLTPTDNTPLEDTSFTISGMLTDGTLYGNFIDESDALYSFHEDGSYTYETILTGSQLTIAAFRSVLGTPGAWLVSIGITLFAFSTILGWEYHGEKAFEYLLGTHKYNMAYRIFFSLIAYVGCTQTLNLVWNFSDIANALMAIPNLICMLILSNEIARDTKEFQEILKKERNQKETS